MKLLRHLLIGLGAAGFILAALTVLLFNRSAFGWQALSVPTGSMRPTMSPGALAITHQVPISSLKVGDIITHTNPLNMRTTLTHRIVKVYKMNGRIPAFVTKGDANPSPDRPVVGGLVQGKMVAHIPFVGAALMWAKTWTGIAVLVYLPALIVMLEETRRMAVYLRQMKPYHLEGWLPPKRSERRLHYKPAMAVSAAVSLVVAGVGWQAAGALASSQTQSSTSTVLLVLPRNEIEAKAMPKSPGPNTRVSCMATTAAQVNNSSTQTATTGNATAAGSGRAKSGSTRNTNATAVGVHIAQGC